MMSKPSKSRHILDTLTRAEKVAPDPPPPPPPVPPPPCSTCPYYWPADSTCHERPPQIMTVPVNTSGQSPYQGRWTPVAATDFCGQHPDFAAWAKDNFSP